MAAYSDLSRDDRDIFRLAPSVDEAMIQVLANRLEFRGADPEFVRLSQSYFDHLPLSTARRILALGCGTGIETRALARRSDVTAEIIGVDHSPGLIAVAVQRTRESGLDNRIHYHVGDAHRLEFDDSSFDIVLLHTLISHVDNPLQALQEARRVVVPDGTIAIFDGDYASLTFAYPEPVRAKEIEEVLLSVMVANPRVMRDMPRLLREAQLELVTGWGVVYPNIGTASFWANAAEAYGVVMAGSGLLPQDVVEEWRSYQIQAVKESSFFGASNYYTYLARRSSPH